MSTPTMGPEPQESAGTPDYFLGFTGRAARHEAERLTTRLDALPDNANLERAELLSRLAAAELPYDRAGAASTAQRAGQAALAAHDERAVAYALVAESVVDLSPRTLDKRTQAARRALEICVRTGERNLASTAYFLLLGALTEAGDIGGLDRELALKTSSLGAFDALLEERHATWFRCMRATMDGRLDEALKLADAGYSLATRAADPDAEIVWASQTAVVKWIQAAPGEVEPMLLRASQEHPDEPVWTAAVARIWSRQGRTDAATGVMASLPPLESFPRDRNWLAAVAILADAAAALGAEALAPELYAALAPYEDRLVTIGLGVTCWGAVAHILGRLAVTLGDIGGAERHYRDSIELYSRIGAHVWLAEAQCELAEILLETEPRPAEARELARQAVSTANHLALGDLEVRARRLMHTVRRPDPDSREVSRAQLSPPSADVPHVRVFDTFSVTAADGRVMAWRSRKAALLLKILVARRGSPIPREQLLDLLWPGEPATLLANRLAVAVSTVRSALDPTRLHPRDHFLTVDTHIVTLNRDRLWIDCDVFLRHVQTALTTNSSPGPALDDEQYERLTAIVDFYQGSCLADEPYSAWADSLRRDVDTQFCAAAHTLARESARRGDHFTCAELYRRIIEVDEFDELAYRGLADALEAAGAHGQARQVRTTAQERLLELGIDAES